MVLSCRLYSGASEYVVETSTVTALPASSLFASVVVKRDLLTLKAHSSTTCMYIKTTIYWHACLRKKEYICGQWTHFSRRLRRQPRPNTGSPRQDWRSISSGSFSLVDVARGVRHAILRREIYLRLCLRPSCTDAGSTLRARRVAGNSNHLIKWFNPQPFFQRARLDFGLGGGPK